MANKEEIESYRFLITGRKDDDKIILLLPESNDLSLAIFYPSSPNDYTLLNDFISSLTSLIASKLHQDCEGNLITSPNSTILHNTILSICQEIYSKNFTNFTNFFLSVLLGRLNKEGDYKISLASHMSQEEFNRFLLKQNSQ